MAILSCSGGKTENYTLLAKFGENDCERITWLMKLFTRYSKKVGAVANHLKSKQIAYLDSFELYKKKCGDGFSTLHVSIDVVKEYRDNIGNAGGTKTVIEKCIARLEENYDQRMELDAQENSGQSMELGVPEKPDQEAVEEEKRFKSLLLCIIVKPWIAGKVMIRLQEESARSDGLTGRSLRLEMVVMVTVKAMAVLLQLALK
ncbi:hypothetical protein C5167_007217 [Papaver somniferum]|uniref:Beta-catenin-like protein 1 N-terminal domain-containing protein n=1 Tax=Papaver somniferum TaxID=3469 RepID=A0A4Y7JFK4_PAPSO|nr:hypothetical protein C5167_007217 [Papaver somniferum]